MPKDKRIPPKNSEWYNWKDFCKWADKEGIGHYTKDWILWWKCWIAAFISALQ